MRQIWEKRMSDREDSTRENKRLEKLKAEQDPTLIKDDLRKRAHLAREEEIEKAKKAKDAGQAEKNAAENIKDLAREKARKDIYLAQEKKLAEEHQARRLKDKK
jgi:hypothetical protein